jgi:hypothetical protein
MTIPSTPQSAKMLGTGEIVNGSDEERIKESKEGERERDKEGKGTREQQPRAKGEGTARFEKRLGRQQARGLKI